jgi:hypothetical protein
MRETLGYEACTIDRLYLVFNARRAVRIVVALILLSSVSGLTHWVRGTQVRALIATAAFVALTTILRILAVRTRVSAGCFGTTEYEARELLRFLSKLYESPEVRVDPPGPLRRVVEEANRVTIPHDAEAAL